MVAGECVGCEGNGQISFEYQLINQILREKRQAFSIAIGTIEHE